MLANKVAVVITTGIGASLIIIGVYSFRNWNIFKLSIQKQCMNTRSEISKSSLSKCDQEGISQKSSKANCAINCPCQLSPFRKAVNKILSVFDSYFRLTSKNKTSLLLTDASSDKNEKMIRMSTDAENNENNVDDVMVKEQLVRNVTETVVVDILGTDVDDACIFRMYDDHHYDRIFDVYHKKLSNTLASFTSALDLPTASQSPSSAQTNLKRLIEQLLRDTSSLPNLANALGSPPPIDDQIDGTSYEDLLATAILNKVISRTQRSQTSTPTHPDGPRNRRRNRRDSSASISSLEEFLLSDSSLGSTKYVDRMSLTIQQTFEDVPSTHFDSNSDSASHSSSHSIPDPNWFFKKTRSDRFSPSPVPMLVPNPDQEARILIGDKQVEDTSDLSDLEDHFEGEIPQNEAGNFGTNRGTNAMFLSDIEQDFDEDELDFGTNLEGPGEEDFATNNNSIPNVLVRSKLEIGGKNPTIVSTFSDVESSADSGMAREDRYSMDITIDDDNIEDISITSNLSSSLYDKGKSSPVTLQKNRENLRTSEETAEIIETEETEKPSKKFNGSYSRKEREKWNNPIEMSNNPYSKEKMEERIRMNSLYGSDYYARQASLPSGTHKEQEKNDRSWIKSISQDDHDDIHTAFPAITEDTSMSDNSYVNYYDVENSTVYQKNSDQTGFTINFHHDDESLQSEPEIKNGIVVKVGQGLLADQEREKTTEIKVGTDQGLLFDPDVDSFEEKPIVKVAQGLLFDPKVRSFEEKPTVKVAQGLLFHPEVDSFEEKPSVKAAQGLLFDPEVDSFEEKPTVKVDQGLLFDPEVDSFEEKPTVKVDQGLLFDPEVDSPEQKPTVKVSQGLLAYPEPNVKISPDLFFHPDLDSSEAKPTVKVSQGLLVYPEPPKIETSIKKEPELNVKEHQTAVKPPTSPNFMKSDNTLIRKIYSDPIVRNFALINRTQLPVPHHKEVPHTPRGLRRAESLNLGNLSRSEVSLNTLYIEDFNRVKSPASPNEEIAAKIAENNAEKRLKRWESEDIYELKEKKLVASVLGQISRNYPQNVPENFKENVPENFKDAENVPENFNDAENVPENSSATSEAIEIDQPVLRTLLIPPTIRQNDSFMTAVDEMDGLQQVSVKQLKKLFEKSDEKPFKDRPVHSLTARTIAKDIRTKLQSD